MAWGRKGWPARIGLRRTMGDQDSYASRQNWLPSCFLAARSGGTRAFLPAWKAIAGATTGLCVTGPVGGSRLFRSASPASTSVTARPRSAVVRISVRPGASVRSASPERHDARPLAFPTARDFDAVFGERTMHRSGRHRPCRPDSSLARFSARTFPGLRTISARSDPGKAVRETGEVPGATTGGHAHDTRRPGRSTRATIAGDRSFGHCVQARAPLDRMSRRVSNRCRMDTARPFRFARAWNTMVNAEATGDTSGRLLNDEPSSANLPLTIAAVRHFAEIRRGGWSRTPLAPFNQEFREQLLRRRDLRIPPGSDCRQGCVEIPDGLEDETLSQDVFRTCRVNGDAHFTCD